MHWRDLENLFNNTEVSEVKHFDPYSEDLTMNTQTTVKWRTIISGSNCLVRQNPTFRLILETKTTIWTGNRSHINRLVFVVTIFVVRVEIRHMRNFRNINNVIASGLETIIAAWSVFIDVLMRSIFFLWRVYPNSI